MFTHIAPGCFLQSLTMEARVRLLNNLPRSEKTPSGLPNHWVFGVCHVDLDPPGDLLLAVHPQSIYLNQAGPAQILSLASVAEKAEAIIPCLLDSFIFQATDHAYYICSLELVNSGS